jgi:hypothetical protein
MNACCGRARCQQDRDRESGRGDLQRQGAQGRTLNYEGKPKRVGRYAGHRSAWKKAVVTLAEGQTIELFEQV